MHSTRQGNMTFVFTYWCSISSFCIFIHSFRTIFSNQHEIDWECKDNNINAHKHIWAVQFCNKINCTNGSMVNDRQIQSVSLSFYIFFYYSNFIILNCFPFSFMYNLFHGSQDLSLSFNLLLCVSSSIKFQEVVQYILCRKLHSKEWKNFIRLKWFEHVKQVSIEIRSHKVWIRTFFFWLTIILYPMLVLKCCFQTIENKKLQDILPIIL